MPWVISSLSSILQQRQSLDRYLISLEIIGGWNRQFSQRAQGAGSCTNSRLAPAAYIDPTELDIFERYSRGEDRHWFHRGYGGGFSPGPDSCREVERIWRVTDYCIGKGTDRESRVIARSRATKQSRCRGEQDCHAAVGRLAMTQAHVANRCISFAALCKFADCGCLSGAPATGFRKWLLLLGVPFSSYWEPSLQFGARTPGSLRVPPRPFPPLGQAGTAMSGQDFG